MVKNSKPKSTKKVVSVKESALVDLIDNLVNEVIETKKKEWLAEHNSKKKSMLESKVNRLEKLVSELTKK